MTTVEKIVASTPELPENAKFGYGTAGFRTTGSLLPSVGFRVGLLVALRAAQLGNRPLGVMVTASHNPAKDNGVKIVDADGGMLSMAWEPLATELANTKDGAAAAEVFDRIAKSHARDEATTSMFLPKIVVHVGRDTRPTGVDICKNLNTAIELCGGVVVDHGEVTTPILHEMVYQSREGAVLGEQLAAAAAKLPNVDQEFNSEFVAKTINTSLYFNKLDDALKSYLSHNSPSTAEKKHIIIDCANGIGAPTMKKLLGVLEASGSPLLSHYAFHLLNTATDKIELLNHECGADHAQKAKVLHESLLSLYSKLVEEDNVDPRLIHLYSYDGDADRIVAFHRKDNTTAPTLLDGDRIIVLLAKLMQQQVAALGELSAEEKPAVGVVQTAYANGASTFYIKKQLGLNVVCTATGVKYLHPAAHAMDLGIYFEANGHGTALLSSKFQQLLNKKMSTAGVAAGSLLAIGNILSQCCGDAIGDLLACEMALLTLGWSFDEWIGCYSDLPSVQLKATVPDPSVITNNPDQTQALTPAGLQDKINDLVKATGDDQARSFVRPSGTEPIVRVYAESSTPEQTAKLGDIISDAVKVFCK